MEYCENKVDDRSISLGGIHLSIRNSLPHMPLRINNDDEWEKILHFVLTSGKYWGPTSLDCEGNLENEI